MAAGDIRDQIAQLEVEIEQLTQTIESCRKAMSLAKFAIGAGTIWILASLLGAVVFGPTSMVAAIAAITAGVVFFGSNSSTSRLAAAAIKDAEALRVELIDKIDLQPAGLGPTNSISERSTVLMQGGPDTSACAIPYQLSTTGSTTSSRAFTRSIQTIKFFARSSCFPSSERHKSATG